MDLSKKRRADENGGSFAVGDATPLSNNSLSPEDTRKILEPFTKDQLIDILQIAVLRYQDVLEAVRSVADADPAKRKLFVRGLGPETTTDKLRGIFSFFGDLDEGIVITDKTTGRSKGYGFVTFRHIDGAIAALKEPSKKIDGRMTVTHLAAAGTNSSSSGGGDVYLRKIYVGNIPFEISSEKLLTHFSAYGEIEEGPLGFDKQSGKAKGFAFFIYKTEEGARASLIDPMKTIDGHQLNCKLAVDGKKGSNGPNAGGLQGAPTNRYGGPVQGSMSGPNYGMGGGYGGYGGAPQPMAHQNPAHNSSMGGGGYGSQGPSSYGGAGGGYGAGSYGGQQYGGAGSGYGGMSNTAPSMYREPQSSIPSGGYSEAGNYGMSGSAPRPPPSGMYQGMPPYY